SLAASLESRKLAGLEIKTVLSSEHLRGFLAAYNSVPRGTNDPAAYIERALLAAGITEVRLLRPGGSGGAGKGTGPVADVENATLLYAKAVVLLREIIRSWEDETVRSYLGARITRVVQGMISLVEKNPRPFLWLIQVKDEREYLF